ncbi:hypothetical protein [Mycobacterium sp. OTB74]|jgi:hypothetical protein|uniref:hypothetical protein n=1 Tax=Mycobacterium sp. OTB74 TaxID=1853452 RepID=UPI0024747E8B|nr:hypothetical protein [Mycobacterium sp. OTB74]MDH6244232.1 hypothetical protein [Mycobacterium sp. OTB74]
MTTAPRVCLARAPPLGADVDVDPLTLDQWKAAPDGRRAWLHSNALKAAKEPVRTRRLKKAARLHETADALAAE